MKQSFPETYISSRFFSIRKNLKQFSRQKAKEPVHRIRVDIKKLRAVFSFLNKIHAQKQFQKKILKQLFNEAGALRELHIFIRLLEKNSGSGRLLGELREKEKALSTKFAGRVPWHLKNMEKMEREIKPVHYSPKKKELKKYFKKQVWKSKALLDNRKNKNDIHRFRMKIKEMMYVYNALSKKWKKSIGLNEKYINRLQNKAGRWHDTFTAIDFFKHKSAVQSGRWKTKEKKQLNSLLELCRDFGTTIYS